jgi:hypothetical protein
MEIIAIVILMSGGLVIIFGSIYKWDLMFRSSPARDLVQAIGTDGAKIVYGVVGLLMIIAAALMIMIPQFNRPLQAKPDATVMLSVEADGCTVLRTEVVGKSSIQHFLWLITDEDFKTVGTLSADDIYTYRHNRSGRYAVVIQAWYEGGYVTISNKVKINCTAPTP